MTAVEPGSYTRVADRDDIDGKPPRKKAWYKSFVDTAVLAPFIDLQHAWVQSLAGYWLMPDDSSMHISAITGEIYVPWSIYRGCASIWLLGAILTPFVMPVFALRALYISRNQPAWADKKIDESSSKDSKKEAEEESQEDKRLRRWDFSKQERVVHILICCGICLCSLALLPAILLMVFCPGCQVWTADECTVERLDAIQFVERYAPMGCSSLCSLALCLHMLSICMVKTAKASFFGEVQEQFVHGIDFGAIASTESPMQKTASSTEPCNRNLPLQITYEVERLLAKKFRIKVH
jgi:hypothetical protein